MVRGGTLGRRAAQYSGGGRLIVPLLFALAGFGVLAWFHPDRLGVLLVATPAALLLMGLSHRRVARPWSDLGAWGALLVALVVLGAPDPADPIGAALGVLAVFALAVAIHVPAAGAPRPRWTQALAVLAIATAATTTLLFLPAFRLEGQALGVLDPATAPGMALRTALVLIFTGGLAATIIILRARPWSRRRNEALSKEENIT